MGRGLTIMTSLVVTFGALKKKMFKGGFCIMLSIEPNTSLKLCKCHAVKSFKLLS